MSHVGRSYRHLVIALCAVMLGTVGISDPGSAQRQDDRGDTQSRDRDDRRGKNSRHVAGKFDYYALVLSWSPTHCASQRPKRNDTQCNPRNGRGYAFVLHGLWPQYTRGYPSSCNIGKRPFVPNNVIDFMQDIMPSRGLTIHEYKKHGTCSGLDPKNYYALSRKLYRGIKVPERFIDPTEAQFVAPDELMAEFTTANPGLRPDMLAVSCGGPGNRLREVRVCFSRKGQLQPCGRNEDQRRLCSAKNMFVPPVRLRRAPSKQTTPERGQAPRPTPRNPSERAL